MKIRMTRYYLPGYRGYGSIRLSWTFKLRPNVKWHDKPFTSEGVKYTYEKLLDPATKSVQRANYQVIEKIETPDPLTVVFHLSEPQDFSTR